jgi:hypothetical protein
MVWSNPYVLGSPIPLCWEIYILCNAWGKLK